MIVSNLIGGLGNQMFQYAAGRALSLQLHRHLYLDISDLARYQLHQGYQFERIFAGEFKVATGKSVRGILGYQGISFLRKILIRDQLKYLRSRKYVVQPGFVYWDQFDQLADDVYLHGYWQSEKYFKKYSDIIRKDFVFKEKLSAVNQSISHQIIQANAVSLHVRRGDYLTSASANEMHGACSLEYYQRAVDEILNRVSDPIFYIFSDDPTWVKKNLKLGVEHAYIDHNHGAESYNDMRLMSICKHHIIANSSFSWWGAWLNANPNKIVIAPKKWFTSDQFDTSDLLPLSWIEIL